MRGAFTISQTDKRPIYLQIMEQIIQRIAVGDWAEGQAIPSIRQLAVDLQVSVITVKRAYLELEREGIIVTQHGKGSHVASKPSLGARLREQELQQQTARERQEKEMARSLAEQERHEKEALQQEIERLKEQLRAGGGEKDKG